MIFHFCRDCKSIKSIRETVRDQLSIGTSAIHIFHDLVSSTEDNRNSTVGLKTTIHMENQHLDLKYFNQAHN